MGKVISSDKVADTAIDKLNKEIKQQSAEVFEIRGVDDFNFV